MPIVSHKVPIDVCHCISIFLQDWNKIQAPSAPIVGSVELCKTMHAQENIAANTEIVRGKN